MYHLQTITVNNTQVAVEWSARMLKKPAKVICKKGRAVVVLSKAIIKSVDEIYQCISNLFERQTIFVTDCGQIHIRGKKVGSGGFSIIYGCVDDPSLIIKTCKNNQGLKEEIDAYKILENAQRKFIPRFRGRIGDESILIEKYETDLFSIANKLGQDHKCSIVVDVIECLRGIHALGFVHCDIKPGNILIGTEGRAVLGDLGLAKPYYKGRKKVDNKNKRYGTLSYMSLDVHFRIAPTRRSDMESLGWMVAELFGDKLPWKGLRDIDKVGTMKKEFVASAENVVAYMSIVKTLCYNEEPKYEEMIKIFQ